MLPKNLNDRKYFQFFQDNVAYTNDAGTAVPIGQFVGGQYNLTAPTYADGDPAVFQFTSSGLLKTDATLSIEGDINIGSVELKDATSDTRAVIKSDGTNNALVVTLNALPSLATGANTIGTVNIGTMGALVAGTETIGSVKITDGTETLQIATDGAAVKTKGIMIMGTDGTNAQTVSMNSDGDVNIADGGNVITVDGSGSAGTAAAGVVTIQGIASMTAVQVGDNSSSLSIDIGGTAPQLDDTDKIAVSLYGKGTSAGDNAIETDGSGNLQVVGTGTAGTAAGGVLTIQGVASMTAVTVAQATAANLNCTEASAASILTSVQLIDDAIYVDDADWTTDTSKHLLVGGLYGPNTITDGDVGPIAINASGEVKVVQATAANLNVTEASASTISSAVATPTTLTGGSTTVTTPSTAVVLGTTLATKSIYIRALSTNTSFVCIGDVNVDQADAATQQIILYANDSVTIDIANRVTVYIDADVGTEGVSYLCMS